MKICVYLQTYIYEKKNQNIQKHESDSGTDSKFRRWKDCLKLRLVWKILRETIWTSLEGKSECR